MPCTRSHPISSSAIITELLYFPPCRCHDGFYFSFRVSAEDPVARYMKSLFDPERLTQEPDRQRHCLRFPLSLPAAGSNSGGSRSPDGSEAASTTQLGRSRCWRPTSFVWWMSKPACNTWWRAGLIVTEQATTDPVGTKGGKLMSHRKKMSYEWKQGLSFHAVCQL